ncbi:MAG TPA: SpoIID/LytB domain-containing protein [Bacteroidota bacterium]|nr:SpoIID/LytB domain-containing protein [Bacteroidota bacterium]
MEVEPQISVGILSAGSFTLDGRLACKERSFALSGKANVSACADCVAIETDSARWEFPSGIILISADGTPFVIRGVPVGKDFHWRHNEDQRFNGALRLERSGADVLAINLIGLEEYLASVISSEMSPRCSLHFLKAHAIASRSWLLAQLAPGRAGKKKPEQKIHAISGPDRLIRWYDREEHALFDVCADDHCQRYRGVTEEPTLVVRRAVEETRGRVLRYAGEVCDARFSKSCGGITEPFDRVWQNTRIDYLSSVADSAHEGETDVSAEDAARRWIGSRPEAYCSTSDPALISQLLPEQDHRTSDFYRWQLEYPQEEISALIARRSGIDFGAIRSLRALERGPSGRISLLEIEGEKRTFALGKELEIRRVLSPTHLYSSAFLVEPIDVRSGVPRRFRLRGAGWGHGVGMCQIGAAVMGERGFECDAILKHYFTGAEVASLY